KVRRDRNIEPTVTIKDRRIVAIFLETFAVGQEHRDLCAILTLIEDLFGRELFGVEGDLRTKEHCALSGLEIVAVDSRRLGEADVGIKRLGVFAFPREAARCSQAW